MKRQPSGTPSGGRFAPDTHDEADVELGIAGDDGAALEGFGSLIVAGTPNDLLGGSELRDLYAGELRRERSAVRRAAILIARDHPDARYLSVINDPGGQLWGAAIHDADRRELAGDIAVDGFGTEDPDSLNVTLDHELNNLDPDRETGGWRDFEVQWPHPHVLALDLRNARAGVGGDGRIVDFPTDVAAASALMDVIPAECFMSGHEGGVRGCREARLDFERFARWGDDTGAAVSAMEAWTSYRIHAGRREDALDQIAEFRQILR